MANATKSPGKKTPSKAASVGVTRPEQLVNLLKRKSGATIAELQDKFGWQPHTARAAISGLRKAGEPIERSIGDSGSVYRITARAAKV